MEKKKKKENFAEEFIRNYDSRIDGPYKDLIRDFAFKSSLFFVFKRFVITNNRSSFSIQFCFVLFSFFFLINKLLRSILCRNNFATDAIHLFSWSIYKMDWRVFSIKKKFEKFYYVNSCYVKSLVKIILIKS